MEGISSMGSRSSQKSHPRYRLLHTLGSGTFAEVKLAVHVLTGIKVAIKIFDRRSIRKSSAINVKREINIMKLLTHPHIVRLYEVIQTGSKLFLVMELMNSGDLFDYVTPKGRLQEDEARHFFQQIISGVEYCHLKGVVHRDIKPENLVLDVNCNLKITDFGLGDIMRDGHFLKESCGSADYAAPEVVSGQHYAGPEVDIWSCGVILYVLLCGKMPFDVGRTRLYTKSPAYRHPDFLSSDAQNLITRMFDLDPVNRISIPEIRKHPWFQHNLPQYIAIHPNEATCNEKKIDEDIVREVANIGFNMKTVVKSLQNGLHNEATVSYFLFLDNHQANRSTIEDEHQQMPNETEHPGIYLRPLPSDEQSWQIGFQSHASPLGTMGDVLKVLVGLNVRFKKIGHYNVKCLWLPQFFTCSISKQLCGLAETDHLCSHELSLTSRSTTCTSPRGPLKFEIQLYKASEDMYLLDMQRILGPTLLFLEICSAIDAQMVLFQKNVDALSVA